MLGPLENADLVGTDLTLAIHQTVLPDIESRPGPSPYLEKLVADGKLGFKSGEGFRKWSPESRRRCAPRCRASQEGARDDLTSNREDLMNDNAKCADHVRRLTSHRPPHA